ncbi:DUF3343 domain-containing protein [Orenia marismortui]|uniref:DUF3343 domain-containing protein n=1 Tax=Orenia marismortui TaxID=46469 RepID=UPI00035C804F|nr:DUF3343 domain-containing protein [Orenia marismortui]
MIEEYNLLVFNSTHHSLQAEKFLKANGYKIMMIPILPEISADCGMAIKTEVKDVEITSLLEDNKIEFAAFYHVLKEGLEKRIKKISK